MSFCNWSFEKKKKGSLVYSNIYSYIGHWFDTRPLRCNMPLSKILSLKLLLHLWRINAFD